MFNISFEVNNAVYLYLKKIYLNSFNLNVAANVETIISLICGMKTGLATSLSTYLTIQQFEKLE